MGITQKKSKELKVLEDLAKKMKAVLDSQSVIRDQVSELKKFAKQMDKQLDEIEANTEVSRLTLRRKSNIEELEMLEERLQALEQKLATISY